MIKIKEDAASKCTECKNKDFCSTINNEEFKINILKEDMIVNSLYQKAITYADIETQNKLKDFIKRFNKVLLSEYIKIQNEKP